MSLSFDDDFFSLMQQKTSDAKHGGLLDQAITFKTLLYGSQTLKSIAK